MDFHGPYDLVCMVDTGQPEMLGPWLTLVEKGSFFRAAFDHHPRSAAMEALTDLYLCDESYSSTSEIIFLLSRRLGIRLSSKAALAVLTGLLFDTQHLRLANCTTLTAVHELCQLGASYAEAREILRLERDRSEAIATLKAAQRLEFKEFSGWIIAHTQVNSFQSSVARSLIDLNAHVTIAYGSKDDKIRASARATQLFHSRTGIHLGNDIMDKIASELGGSGGGHPTAASLEIPGETVDILKIIIERLEKKLSDLPPSKTQNQNS
jgi:nanoRNase/pAp phosphatase (c-di-AMP/oligoRNAs hydrolase)